MQCCWIECFFFFLGLLRRSGRFCAPNLSLFMPCLSWPKQKKKKKKETLLCLSLTPSHSPSCLIFDNKHFLVYYHLLFLCIATQYIVSHKPSWAGCISAGDNKDWLIDWLIVCGTIPDLLGIPFFFFSWLLLHWSLYIGFLPWDHTGAMRYNQHSLGCSTHKWLSGRPMFWRHMQLLR